MTTGTIPCRQEANGQALLFLTGNRNKYEEGAIIPEIEMLCVDLPEIRSDDARLIIESKLAQAMIGRDDELIVEDTSLHLDALNGFPDRS